MADMDVKDTNGAANLPPLRIRYYRQMKPQRVWPVTLAWKKTKSPKNGEIVVRLLGAGAQILPLEQTMNSAEPDKKAVFYVTPLAKGWLPHFQLEILVQGRKVQEVPMSAKVVSQRLTWLLLFCTFFVPWFISEFIKFSPMNEKKVAPSGQVLHRYPAKEVEAYIDDNMPPILDVLKDTPVDSAMTWARSAVAKGYQQIVQMAYVQKFSFYAFCLFAGLTLVSAYFHKPKRRSALSKPIALA